MSETVRSLCVFVLCMCLCVSRYEKCLCDGRDLCAIRWWIVSFGWGCIDNEWLFPCFSDISQEITM